jgi:hypothetical protein
MNRFTHRLLKQIMTARSLAVGYQMSFSLVVRELSMKFTTFPPPRSGVLLSLFPRTYKTLRTHLKQVDVPPPSVGHVPSPGVSWWPSVLAGDLDVERIHKSGFELYFAERPATSVTTTVWLFAIDQSKGRGFFYSRH